MKIAYLSTFYPFRGGIAQFNAALFRQLEQHHQISAFNFSRQYPGILFPGSSQYVSANDPADKIETARVLDTLNPLTYFTAAKKINAFQPDLMLMKFWMPYFAPSLGTVSKLVKKKTKIITILDNVIPHEKRPGDLALIKYFLKQNHGFVAMSRAVQNDLLSLKPEAKYIFHQHPLYDHFGQPREKNAARALLQIPDNKKVVLFFGFIRDYKGLDVLISAMKNVDNDTVLVIAGEVYGDFAPYQSLIDQLNLGDRIHTHVRYIGDAEVPDFFSAADVCVLPYKSATQSGITSISYHFDLPMIATDTGGLKESIEHEKTGLIISSADPDLLSAAINRYFAEHSSDIYAANIRQRKAELSWEHLADSIVRFYDEL